MSGFGNIGPFEINRDPFDISHRKLPPDIERDILQGVIPDIRLGRQPKTKPSGDKKSAS